MWHGAGPLSPVVGAGELIEMTTFICALLCLCHLSGPQREKQLINIFPHCKTHTPSFIFDWWQKRRVFCWPIQWKRDTLPEYKVKGNQNLFLIITDTVGDFSLISLNTFWVFNYLLCAHTSHSLPSLPSQAESSGYAKWKYFILGNSFLNSHLSGTNKRNMNKCTT